MSDRMIRFFTVFLSVCTLFVCVFSALQMKARFASSIIKPETVLYIDPGHGGEDGGCVGVNGAVESQINLSVALRLHDLAVFCGLPVKMIRQTDTAVYREGCKSIAEKKVSDIKARVEAVNAEPDTVLVSIHQNYFQQQKYHGAQVFFAPTARSAEFADSMQKALCTCLDTENHRVSKPSDHVYLMQHVQCPAILIECGFLSNQEEAERLLTSAYQKKLISVICAECYRFIISGEESNEV